MTEIISSSSISGDDEDVINQQHTLIGVLKQEIIRLQKQNEDLRQQILKAQSMHEKTAEENTALKQKIDALKENNSSLLQTLEVFQRQFVKPDYKNYLKPAILNMQASTQGPFFMELIRTMKKKIVENSSQQFCCKKRSSQNQYYGYFFHSEVEDAEAELFNQAQTKKSSINKIKKFGKKNFFNQKYRYFFWSNILQNTLNITSEFYQILLNQLQGDKTFLHPTANIIDLDLRRMDFKLDEQKSLYMKTEIKKCLQLFCVYRSDVGYVQGMSYLVWILLIHLNSYQAFSFFCNKILCDPFINSLYTFKKEGINKIVNFFEVCLEDKKPKLSRHMKKNGVQSEFFIIQWAYTFFSRAFNIRIVSKIWDLWFCQGFNVFFKTALTIVEMLENEIMDQTENDKIIEIIRTKTNKLDENQFLKNLSKQKIYENLRL